MDSSVDRALGQQEGGPWAQHTCWSCLGPSGTARCRGTSRVVFLALESGRHPVSWGPSPQSGTANHSGHGLPGTPLSWTLGGGGTAFLLGFRADRFQIQGEEGVLFRGVALFLSEVEVECTSRACNGSFSVFFRSQVKIFDCIDFCSACH